MPGMTPEEVAAFLDEPGRLVRIGTVDADGMPRVVPAWFIVENGIFLVTPRARSAWLANLQRDPRVCFTVDGGGQVIIRGTCRIVHGLGEDDAWRDVYRRMGLHSAGAAAAGGAGPARAEALDRYLRDTRDEPRALIGLSLAEAEVTSWRGATKPDEDPRRYWASRYFHHPRPPAGRP